MSACETHYMPLFSASKWEFGFGRIFYASTCNTYLCCIVKVAFTFSVKVKDPYHSEETNSPLQIQIQAEFQMWIRIYITYGMRLGDRCQLIVLT